MSDSGRVRGLPKGLVCGLRIVMIYLNHFRNLNLFKTTPWLRIHRIKQKKKRPPPPAF
jgi:hypothetical protein